MELKVKTIALGAALALAACGPADDSSGRDIGYTGATTPVAITDANIGDLAAKADAQAGAFAGADATVGVTATGALRSGTSGMVRKALARVAAARRDAGVAVTGAVLTLTAPCDAGGSMALSADNGANQDLTEVGEYVQVSADACDDGLETVWGTVRMEITGTDGADPSAGSDDPTTLTSGVTYGMKLVVTDFVVQDDATGEYMGMDGDIELSLMWDASTFRLRSEMSGTSVATQAGYGSVVTASSLLAGVPSLGGGYSFVGVQEFTDASALTLAAEEVGIVARACSLDLAGCIDLELDPSFRTAYVDGLLAAYPEAGTMRVTGAGGAYFQIDVIDATGAIWLEYDVDGAGMAFETQGPFETTWDCLDQPGNVCAPM